ARRLECGGHDHDRNWRIHIVEGQDRSTICAILSIEWLARRGAALARARSKPEIHEHAFDSRSRSGSAALAADGGRVAGVACESACTACCLGAGEWLSGR